MATSRHGVGWLFFAQLDELDVWHSFGQTGAVSGALRSAYMLVGLIGGCGAAVIILVGVTRPKSRGDCTKVVCHCKDRIKPQASGGKLGVMVISS